ncbi:uncharacterized protein LOC103397473 isoform X2 [Cynoglossus semilaevis]|uniref:uncharacterized protein LOC103397473 isoform X2 n=1 Tax=Cynoglossus semilaevis TaxID=244447 RepID=UPI000D62DA58|nr:uncharacterized protein LOC103397473 isoform X2 [Cynoglossus semilaevis]
MSHRMKHHTELGTHKSLSACRGHRRSSEPKPWSRPFQETRAFPPLPPRPRSQVDTRRCLRETEPLGLQVRGFCCPLQERPGSSSNSSSSSESSSRAGAGAAADRSLLLLSSLRGSLESRAKAAVRVRSGSRAVVTSQTGAGVSPTAESPTTPCINERQAGQGQAGATKVSELHLYLPSTFCEDVDHSSEAEDQRIWTSHP